MAVNIVYHGPSTVGMMGTVAGRAKIDAVDGNRVSVSNEVRGIRARVRPINMAFNMRWSFRTALCLIQHCSNL